VQSNLSLTLNRIKNQKRDGFYSGITAKLLLKEMNKGNGIFTQDDLDKYSSIWRKPIVGYYKDHKIISMGPPSSGGIALLQLLKGIENYNIKNYGFNSLKTINLMAELESRVYADRATHLGDPDFYKVPIEKLINSNYLENKFKNINPLKKTPSNEIKEGSITYNESNETTHFSIVDKFGNAVSITTTLNGSYGSKVVVDGAGFLLNNEMDDFSVKPGFPNMFGLIGGKANSIQPGKRMLSSMTPTIIEKNNNLFMVLGTPGGSTIITSVFQTILNVIDYGMSMQEAVNAKKIHHQWVPDILYVEKNSINNETKEQLVSIGHKINERGSIGRMDCILINSDNKLEGGSDKRGDNIAIGY
jgi:gamma-glutamyltranspeptidase/glutathione hydrolase